MSTLLKLFWAETQDHAEDTCVVSKDAAQAARLHEYEGEYEPGTASVEYLTDIPAHLNAEEGWAHHRIIHALCEVIKSDIPLSIRFNNKIYNEGNYEYIRTKDYKFDPDMFGENGLEKLIEIINKSNQNTH